MKESPAPNEEDRGTRSRNQGRTFPLLSDFKQRKGVKNYDIFNEAQGFGSRAKFVINKEDASRHIGEGGATIDPSATIQGCNLLKKK